MGYSPPLRASSRALKNQTELDCFIPSGVFLVYGQPSIVYKFVRMKARELLSLFLVLTSVLLPLPASAQVPLVPLGISILQGQNGRIDDTHTLEIVVRVTRPGANVMFRLMPGSGASLPGAAVQMTVRSDANGIARSGLLSPTGRGGDFEVEVLATLDGQTAMTTAHETNGIGSGTGKPAHKSHALMWVAIIGGAGAGAALALATSKKGSSTSLGPPVTITAGNPTIGAPQ